MTTDWLILDCNNLFWRSFHVLGHLSFRKEPTGAIYGFFRDLIGFRDSFRPDKVIFCFDSPGGSNLRLKHCPTYKNKRLNAATSDPRELRAKETARSHLEMLRTECLTRLGFRNILWHWGYEADDMIATAANAVPEDKEAVIVSNDKDILQLIRGNVSVWNYKRMTTLQTFNQEYGILPDKWPLVKAMAGCKSDCIPGIRDIGELTALKYIKATLPHTSSYHKKITAGHETWRSNLPLVTLPFEGCPKFTPQKDSFNFSQWERFCKKLGMTTLIKRPPSGNGHLRKD